MSESFRVGEWTIVPEANQFINDSGDIISVEPKMMDVLCHLVRKRQETVKREELRLSIWKSQVGEGAINRVIAELRSSLNDDVRKPRFIETIPKKGYRFVGTVESVRKSKLNRPSRFFLLLSILLIISIGAASLLFFNGDNRTEWLAPSLITQKYQLTNLPGAEYAAVVNSNAEKLAFLYRRKGETNGNIVVQILSTNDYYQITDNDKNSYSPSWSHQGNLLVFVEKKKKLCKIQLADVTDISAPAITELFDCNPFGTPKVIWADDDKSLFFTEKSHKDQPYAIYRYFLESGRREQLTNPGNNEHWDYRNRGPYKGNGDYWMSLSPDKSKLVFLRDFYWNETDVYIYDIESRRTKEIFDQGYTISSIHWSNDSRSLYFKSSPSSVATYSLENDYLQTIIKENTRVYSAGELPNEKSLMVTLDSSANNIFMTENPIMNTSLGARQLTDSNMN